jgi:hypothetical protein
MRCRCFWEFFSKLLLHQIGVSIVFSKDVTLDAQHMKIIRIHIKSHFLCYNYPLTTGVRYKDVSFSQDPSKVYCYLFALKAVNYASFFLKRHFNIAAFMYQFIIIQLAGSSVSIATGYGLDGPGIESRWGVRFSAPVQTGHGSHPASCAMCTGSFPEVESGRGVTLTSLSLLVPRSKNRIELYLYCP